MAKPTSLIKFQGTFMNMTTVRSKAYGEHIRAARGTHTKIKMNDAFKKSTEDLKKCNVAARLIKNAFDHYRQDFPGGQLWQRLLSIFRQQYKQTGSFSVEGLMGLEIHKEYPFSRFLHGYADVSIDSKKKTMTVMLRDAGIPIFKKKPVYIDGYRISFIVIFPDFKKEKVMHADYTFPVKKLSESFDEESCVFELSKGVDEYLVCCKVEACEKGNVCEVVQTKGMVVMEVGRIK